MVKRYEDWRHAFKLDPAKTLSDEALERICLSGTDAIIIGGTDNITLENVMNLFYRVRKYSVFCALEISRIESVLPGFDAYFVPLVLNSNDKKWLLDIQHEAVKEYGQYIPWRQMFAEGYCVMNKDAKVFTYTDCSLPSKADVLAYALMAENIYKLPIFYLEYSGTIGDVELIEEVSHVLQGTRFFYGGGITTKDEAAMMAEFADTIIVGNALYTDLEKALETVEVVKAIKRKKV